MRNVNDEWNQRWERVKARGGFLNTSAFMILYFWKNFIRPRIIQLIVLFLPGVWLWNWNPMVGVLFFAFLIFSPNPWK